MEVDSVGIIAILSTSYIITRIVKIWTSVAKIPRVPVENQITTLSVVKIAIKFSPYSVLYSRGNNVLPFYREDKSVMDAATKGAMAGIPLVLGIVANIVAFVSLIEFLNAILTWFGSLVGYTDLTFEVKHKK